MSPLQRAERRILKLRAMLESETSLRLKPVLWGKMERRKRLEAALARAEFVMAQPSAGGVRQGLQVAMPFVPKVPDRCGDLDMDRVARVLAKHHAYFPAAPRELGVSPVDLKRLRDG